MSKNKFKYNKPKNQIEYEKWLKSYLDISVNSKMKTRYNTVSNKILADFRSSSIWQDLNSNLTNINAEYLSSTGYQLFIDKFKPKLVTKPFKSFLEKSFRKNILFNKNWVIDNDPKPPNGGWVTPDNWYEKTNDILRTCFIVKYLDGVEFLIEKIVAHCESYSLTCNKEYEARDEGYYDVHIYTQYKFEIPKLNWDTEAKNISIELQITTQVQDVIGTLTHKYYEQRRLKMNKRTDKKWQWDYESEEFTPNYLGHILHYVEGMIMEVRKQLSKT